MLNAGADPHPALPSTRAELWEQEARGVSMLPGVTRVFASSSGICRWFDGPVSQLVEVGPATQAWITVGVGRHSPCAETAWLIAASLRTRLAEHGIDTVDVMVRIALFE